MTIKTTFRNLLMLLASFALLPGPRADEVADATLTRVGQSAPDFQCTTLKGEKLKLSSLRGKVVLLNFFATWCGPCMAELPELEKQVWARFGKQNFAMIAIGREHSVKELAEFQKKKRFTFPLAADPDRAIYRQYARQFIPRNIVIDAAGKIVFQSAGFAAKEFNDMVSVIEKELETGKGR